MGRPKKIIEKVAEAVDHVLHPHPESGPEKVQTSTEAQELHSHKEYVELAKHPKFAKFKTTREN